MRTLPTGDCAMLKSVFEFINDIFTFGYNVMSYWQSYITGGIVAAVVVLYERLTKHAFSNRAIVVGVMVFLLTSFFMAWRAEYHAHISSEKELIDERDRNAVKLRGEIVQITSGSDMINKEKIVVLLAVVIRNAGVDSVAINYRAKVSFGNQATNIDPTVLPDDGFTLRDKKGKAIRVFSQSDSIYEKTLIPIKRGEIKAGVLLFVINKNQIKHDIINADWTLFFDDYLGKTYEIHFHPNETENGPFKYVPGAGGSEPKKTRAR